MTSPLLEEKIGVLLCKKRMKLTLAESCTGGLIGHRVTNIPGSSEYYLGSLTAYAYEVKEGLLGVKHETLQNYGAVSRQTVVEMASGVRKALSGGFPLDKVIGVSVSGIAGPGGGMPDKPVGTVWIGLSASDGDYAWKFNWPGNRIQNKEDSAEAALTLIWLYLQGRLPSEELSGNEAIKGA